MINTQLPPPPPVKRPPLVPPYRDSINNVVVRRLRAAGTMFGDRVKLVLRPDEIDHWTFLKKPYLLVVPTQTRNPRKLDLNEPMSFINPRELTLVAQFDDRGSEASYLAANDIDTAESQLIQVLANWLPVTIGIAYEPTLYGGMRLQATRAPDVKVNYMFTVQEWKVIVSPDIDGDSTIDDAAIDARFDIHVQDPCACLPCEIIPLLSAEFLISGGGCRVSVPDPCEPDPCPPILGGDPYATTQPSQR